MPLSPDRFDRVIKWASLGAVPVLLLIGYLARSSPEPKETPSADAPAPPASGTETTTPLDESWPPKRAPEVKAPKAQPEAAAVDLPVVSTARPQRQAARGPTGPCGGIVVRGISHDADTPRANVAPAADSPAELKEVGDSVGGYRISRIDWDRVWFASGGGLCSIGIHPGARTAQEGGGRLLELVDGGTPGRAQPDPNTPAQNVTGGGIPLEIAEGIRTDSLLETSVEGFAVRALRSRGKHLLRDIKLEEADSASGHRGVRVSGVRAESLLERLGLQDQDVILAIDDQPMLKPAQLLEWLDAWLASEPKEAHTYRVLLLRGDAAAPERLTLELTLGA